MICGIDHVTINVKDSEKSKWFYETFLGLAFLQAVDMGDQLISYYRLNDETRLELIGYYDKQQTAKIQQKDLGYIRHFALCCESLEHVWKKCEENKIPYRMRPTEMSELGCRGILIEDPNGVEVEIIEKL